LRTSGIPYQSECIPLRISYFIFQYTGFPREDLNMNMYIIYNNHTKIIFQLIYGHKKNIVFLLKIDSDIEKKCMVSFTRYIINFTL
jgi:hypothetical protein